MMLDDNNTATTQDAPAAPATQAPAAPKRKSEADLLKRHPHMIEGTLTYISPLGTCDNADIPTELCTTHPNKQVCQIRTRGVDGQFDGKTRWIATSDLHQCFWTVETKKALDAAKRNQKAKDGRQALKALKAQLAAKVEEVVA